MNKIFKAILFVMMVSLLGSCIPQKKLRYLQPQEESTIDTTKSNEIDKAYQLKAKDEIYLRVNSVDPNTYMFFNGGESNTANQFNSDLGLYLNSYTISDDGSIQLPVAGEIQIAGLSIEAARATVEGVLQKYLNDVTVTIKLSGFKITLVGEVKRPGRYTPYVSQLNILEALALAGDMTSYGNRTRVMIIREEKGKEHIHIINLLDQNLLQSEDFNLLPNDIVYVESLNAKTWGFEQFPYALILSSLTTFIALMTLMRTM
jgi:polysaccharide export outer membrane protein